MTATWKSGRPPPKKNHPRSCHDSTCWHFFQQCLPFSFSTCSLILNHELDKQAIYCVKVRAPFYRRQAIHRSLHKNYMGSMLWSQFSAIFANFRRKNWRFSQKPMLWSKFCIILIWVKNANFFAEFFGENIWKIITSVPGRRTSSQKWTISLVKQGKPKVCVVPADRLHRIIDCLQLIFSNYGRV
jgi:hypothetical protein